MSETETVREELDSYIKDMNQKRHDLANFQMGRPEGSPLIVESSEMINQIDGLMTKLSEKDLSEKIDLNTIVKISTDVETIRTNANRLLAKR